MVSLRLQRMWLKQLQHLIQRSDLLRQVLFTNIETKLTFERKCDTDDAHETVLAITRTNADRTITMIRF